MTDAAVLAFLNQGAVLGLLQLAVGKILKGHPKFDNKFIPWFTFVVSLLGYTLSPAAAHAAGVLGKAGGALSVGLAAVLQTVLVTGIHSFSKNSILPILTGGLKTAAFAFLGGDKDNADGA